MRAVTSRLQRDSLSTLREWSHAARERARRRTLLSHSLAAMLRHRQAAAFRRWHCCVLRRRAAAQGVESRRRELATLAFFGWRHVVCRSKAMELQQQSLAKRLCRFALLFAQKLIHLPLWHFIPLSWEIKPGK